MNAKVLGALSIFITIGGDMLTVKSAFSPIVPKNDRQISTRSYVDSLFNDFFDNVFSDITTFSPLPNLDSKKQEDGSLSISVDLPGVQESDVSIEMIENVISIKGERKTATSSYSINRSFTVPEGYDSENITAELKNGVLQLTIPGKPLPPPKEVKKIPLISNK